MSQICHNVDLLYRFVLIDLRLDSLDLTSLSVFPPVLLRSNGLSVRTLQG
jgi:hypothetical protein